MSLHSALNYTKYIIKSKQFIKDNQSYLKHGFYVLN